MGILAVFRFVRRTVAGLLSLVLLALVVTAGFVIVKGLHVDRTRSDAIVVMGAAQFDGEPSPVLENRLRYAYALYSAGVAPRIVTVGGKQPGDRFTEAAAGKRFLHELGVPYSDLSSLPTGRDTYSSAAAVAAWAEKRGLEALTVVSDRCHEARAGVMLGSFGLDVRGASPASGPGSAITWAYVARETAGLLRFWFVSERGTGSSAGAPDTIGS